MVRCLVLVAMLAAGNAHAQVALGFKGVALGADRAVLVDRFPALRCRSADAGSRYDETCRAIVCPGQACAESWNALRTYGGVEIDGVVFQLLAGRFEGFEIAFPWYDWGRVRDAAKGAYGDGFEEVQQMQGLRGLPYPSRVWGIELPSGRMAIFERAGGDRGLLTCRSGTLDATPKRAPPQKGGDT